MYQNIFKNRPQKFSGIFQEFPFLKYRIYNLFLNFSDCSRILFATWWLYVVILTSSYTGGLTAFMSSTG